MLIPASIACAGAKTNTPASTEIINESVGKLVITFFRIIPSSKLKIGCCDWAVSLCRAGYSIGAIYCAYFNEQVFFAQWISNWRYNEHFDDANLAMVNRIRRSIGNGSGNQRSAYQHSPRKLPVRTRQQFGHASIGQPFLQTVITLDVIFRPAARLDLLRGWPLITVRRSVTGGADQKMTARRSLLCF